MFGLASTVRLHGLEFREISLNESSIIECGEGSSYAEERILQNKLDMSTQTISKFKFLV